MRKEGGDWMLFVLAMLNEAANCPWPCKANLHVPSSFSAPLLCCLYSLSAPPRCEGTHGKDGGAAEFVCFRGMNNALAVICDVAVSAD